MVHVLFLSDVIVFLVAVVPLAKALRWPRAWPAFPWRGRLSRRAPRVSRRQQGAADPG